MDNAPRLIVDLVIVLVLIFGIALFRRRRSARAGNLMAAVALACALAVALSRDPLVEPFFAVAALLLGAAAAYPLAMRVRMIHIPSMVAFQNGAGGLAACLVSLVELWRGTGVLAPAGAAGGILALALGAATFSGSMVAVGKLAGAFRQTPVRLPWHGVLLAAAFLATLLTGALAGLMAPAPAGLFLVVLGLALCVGLVLSVRVGGADMPVLISLLNAGTGLAAAFTGMVVGNSFLIACGAMVGASGTILTLAMCRAMNRSIPGVLTGGGVPSGPIPSGGTVEEETPAAPPEQAPTEPFDAAVAALRGADTVIIVPGYGMALAQAQSEVVRLADRLESLGKEVCFAIHPVAGRMPGHMNVLLAEAEADYEKLLQMEAVNPRFKDADVALVVGACDVVNPAAIDVEGTPISGMPILMAREAGRVVVCNLDEKPGYSGVENPLYESPKALPLWGDAKETVARLLQALD